MPDPQSAAVASAAAQLAISRSTSQSSNQPTRPASPFLRFTHRSKQGTSLDLDTAPQGEIRTAPSYTKPRQSSVPHSRMGIFGSKPSDEQEYYGPGKARKLDAAAKSHPSILMPTEDTTMAKRTASRTAASPYNIIASASVQSSYLSAVKSTGTSFEPSALHSGDRRLSRQPSSIPDSSPVPIPVAVPVHQKDALSWEQLQKDREELTLKLKGCTDQLNHWRNQASQCQQQHESLQHEHRRQVTNLQQDSMKLTNQVQQLQQQNAHLQHQVKQLEEVKLGLEKQVMDATQECERLAQQMQELREAAILPVNKLGTGAFKPGFTPIELKSLMSDLGKKCDKLSAAYCNQPQVLPILQQKLSNTNVVDVGSLSARDWVKLAGKLQVRDSIMQSLMCFVWDRASTPQNQAIHEIKMAVRRVHAPVVLDKAYCGQVSDAVRSKVLDLQQHLNSDRYTSFKKELDDMKHPQVFELHTRRELTLAHEIILCLDSLLLGSPQVLNFATVKDSKIMSQAADVVAHAMLCSMMLSAINPLFSFDLSSYWQYSMRAVGKNYLAVFNDTQHKPREEVSCSDGLKECRVLFSMLPCVVDHEGNVIQQEEVVSLTPSNDNAAPHVQGQDLLTAMVG